MVTERDKRGAHQLSNLNSAGSSAAREVKVDLSQQTWLVFDRALRSGAQHEPTARELKAHLTGRRKGAQEKRAKEEMLKIRGPW